jgi:hypothetical protein
MSTANTQTQSAPAALFETGQFYLTRSAQSLLAEHKQSAVPFYDRHIAGDWSEMDLGDQRANEFAIKRGERIVSKYRLGTNNIWIITEADRSSTTMLLPEEY